jgi:NAD(P)-dependent dehydrogenase (short-subunit alcohol dehydrogenase family)
MTDTPKIVVYGAGGYTGKLVAESLAQRGVSFIAAGRSAERLAKGMEVVKERLGRDLAFEIAAVNNTVDELQPLFEKVDIVINVVGPFMLLGAPVIEAASLANCHYLDTTGEQDWSLEIKEKYGDSFAERRLLLAPAMAWMCAAGSLAAEVCLETEGIDTLDLVYQLDNVSPSDGSTRTFLRMACAEGGTYYLENNELKSWANDRSYPVVIPNSSRVYSAHPWGGFMEPLWYKDDARVRSCYALMAFGEEHVDNVVAAVKKFESEARHLSYDEQMAYVNAIADQMNVCEPAKDNVDIHRSTIVCHGRGRRAASQYVLHLAVPYSWTGEICAEAAQRILEGKLKRSGFQSAARAFGHRELLKVWYDAGTGSMPE